MERTIKIIFLITVILHCSLIQVFAKEFYNNEYAYLNSKEIEEFSNIKANNILLYNLNDNKILYKRNSEEKISIASLTKIMTALVAIEKIEDLNQTIKIPKESFHNTNGYSKAGFKTDDLVTYYDLLYGTLLPSGAEAAQTLAIAISGTIDNFSQEMNQLALKIGMDNTHYSNPIGRDDDQNYSTVTDVAKLLLYALDNPIFYNIYTARYYKASNGLNLYSTIVYPTKKYNLNIENILGYKTGYTKNAGLCLSSIAEYDNIKYLLIVANSPYADGYPNHIVDSLTIYNYYFKNYSYRKIMSKGQQLFTLNIKDGIDKNYTITSDKDVYLYLKNTFNLEQIQYNYSGIDSLSYKIKKNEKLGNIEILSNEGVLYKYNVYLKENIKYKYTNLIFFASLFLIVFICLVFYLINKKRILYKQKI